MTSLILVVLFVLGIVLSLVGALDLGMSMSRLVHSVMRNVNADTDIGVDWLRGFILLVLGIFLLVISWHVSKLIEDVYHQIEDAFLQ
jgi:uncharacterized membrane protein